MAIEAAEGADALEPAITSASWNIADRISQLWTAKAASEAAEAAAAEGELRATDTTDAVDPVVTSALWDVAYPNALPGRRIGPIRTQQQSLHARHTVH